MPSTPSVAPLLSAVGRAARRLGARRRDRRRRAQRHHPAGARLVGPRPRRRDVCPSRPAGCSARSTTSSAPASSRATSSRSRPSGSSRSGPARSGCSRDPDVEDAGRACSRSEATNECGRGRRGLRLRLRRRPGDDQRPRRRRGRRPRGDHRRQLGVGRGRLLQPRSRRRGAGRRHVRPARAGVRPDRRGRGRRRDPGLPAGRARTTCSPARIRSEQRLRSPNIYGEGTVIREVFSLRGLVRPGNSGGPIVSSAGDVVGVVFAASVTDRETGYALTADQVARSAAVGGRPATTRSPPATAPPGDGLSPCRAAPSGSPCPGGSPPRGAHLLHLADADEDHQRGQQQVEAEDDQERPLQGQALAVPVDEVGDRHGQHDDRQHRMNAAAANRPTPMPPALTLTFSSDLTSWISLEIRVEMSRWASVTRRPMVGLVLGGRGSVLDRFGCHGRCRPLLVGRFGADPTRAWRWPRRGSIASGEPGSLVGTWSARLRPVPTRESTMSGTPARKRLLFPDPTTAESTFLGDLLRRETVGGAIALLAAAVAVLWANSPWSSSYDAVRHFDVGPLDLEHWAADGALALFFFVAGLELKREFVVGCLRRPIDAAVPVVAAICGVAVPAAIYLVVNGARGGRQAGGLGDPGRDRHRVRAGGAGGRRLQPADGSAGVPADARGRRRPDRGGHHRRSSTPTSSTSCWFAAAAVGCVVLGAPAAVRGCGAVRLYLPLAVFVWWCVHESGVHATIAGMVLALLTRVRPDPAESASPAEHLEHLLSPLSVQPRRTVLRPALRRRRPRCRGRPDLGPGGDRRRARPGARQADRGLPRRRTPSPGSPTPAWARR